MIFRGGYPACRSLSLARFVQVRRLGVGVQADVAAQQLEPLLQEVLPGLTSLVLYLCSDDPDLSDAGGSSRRSR